MAPKHLTRDTAAWWRATVQEYEEMEEHHVRLLTLACEAWDRAEQARLLLGEHGITFADRYGQPRARPEVNIERDARIAFARLLRELDLDGEPEPDPRLPRGR